MPAEATLAHADVGDQVVPSFVQPATGLVPALHVNGRDRHAGPLKLLLRFPKALDWALDRASKAAGIVGCSFRTFRHTFVTRALRRGVPREVVAKMMGHSTAFITERYMHIADDRLHARPG